MAILVSSGDRVGAAGSPCLPFAAADSAIPQTVQDQYKVALLTGFTQAYECKAREIRWKSTNPGGVSGQPALGTGTGTAGDVPLPLSVSSISFS